MRLENDRLSTKNDDSTDTRVAARRKAGVREGHRDSPR